MLCQTKKLILQWLSCLSQKPRASVGDLNIEIDCLNYFLGGFCNYLDSSRILTKRKTVLPGFSQ